MDQEYKVQKRKKVDWFTPKYLHGSTLYGVSTYFDDDRRGIQKIDLEKLEMEELYISEDTKIDFIINEEGEIVIARHLASNETCYDRYEKGALQSMVKTKSSTPVLYDDRGLFYLEYGDEGERARLILWDGAASYIISEIETEDIYSWEFRDGYAGNIIIKDSFFVTIYSKKQNPFEDNKIGFPYLLAGRLKTGKTKRVDIEKWRRTEADMERFGEAFDGIYYEDGQIVCFFFSNKAGEMRTQVFQIEGDELKTINQPYREDK